VPHLEAPAQRYDFYGVSIFWMFFFRILVVGERGASGRPSERIAAGCSCPVLRLSKLVGSGVLVFLS